MYLHDISTTNKDFIGAQKCKKEVYRGFPQYANYQILAVEKYFNNE